MFIKKIEIKNLWGKDFLWDLKEDISILVGKNGSGKSTILQMLNQAIAPVDDLEIDYRVFDPIDEIIIELSNQTIIKANSEERIITSDNQDFNYDFNYDLNLSFIDTFDTLAKDSDANKTLLDTKIFNLKEPFTRYQRNIYKQIISGDLKPENSEQIKSIKDFIYLINELFKYTDKKFDEENFYFVKKDSNNPIEINKLSSGEKQVFLILLTILLQNEKNFVLLMDEPEISLHIEWQRELIRNIKKLNPNCQIIIATHSSTIFYKGWIDKVTKIENIIVASTSLHSSVIVNKIKKSNKVDKIKIEFNKIDIYSKVKKLYLFNRMINKLSVLSIEECYKLLDFIKFSQIYPDIITYTTLISKLNTFKDAKEIFDLIKEGPHRDFKYVRPNVVTLNMLLKNVKTVEKGLDVISEIPDTNEKITYDIQPDIISFSTLLGKAKTLDEIDLIESARKYFSIKPNEIYLNKLKFK